MPCRTPKFSVKVASSNFMNNQYVSKVKTIKSLNEIRNDDQFSIESNHKIFKDIMALQKPKFLNQNSIKIDKIKKQNNNGLNSNTHENIQVPIHLKTSNLKYNNLNNDLNI